MAFFFWLLPSIVCFYACFWGFQCLMISDVAMIQIWIPDLFWFLLLGTFHTVRPSSCFVLTSTSGQLMMHYYFRFCRFLSPSFTRIKQWIVTSTPWSVLRSRSGWSATGDNLAHFFEIWSGQFFHWNISHQCICT